MEGGALGLRVSEEVGSESLTSFRDLGYFTCPWVALPVLGLPALPSDLYHNGNHDVMIY